MSFQINTSPVFNTSSPFGTVPNSVVSNKSSYFKFTLDSIKSEQSKTIVRSVIWYFGWPFFFFIILAPGFLLSLPPAADCDDGVKKPFAPERTTVANVFVHAFIFLFLVIFMYWLGATRLGIYFPFMAKSIENVLTYSGPM